MGGSYADLMASPAPADPAARPAAAVPPAPVPPAGATPGALVRWMFDILNTHRVEPLRVLWDSGTRERTPARTYRGSEAIAGYWAGLFAAIPDAIFTIEAMAEDGETVFVRWRMQGTHSGGEFEGVAASGKPIDLDGIDHIVLHDGRLVSTFAVLDQMQFARQVGLLPEPGSRLEVGMRRAFNVLTRRRA